MINLNRSCEADSYSLDCFVGQEKDSSSISFRNCFSLTNRITDWIQESSSTVQKIGLAILLPFAFITDLFSNAPYFLFSKLVERITEKKPLGIELGYAQESFHGLDGY